MCSIDLLQSTEGGGGRPEKQQSQKKMYFPFPANFSLLLIKLGDMLGGGGSWTPSEADHTQTADIKINPYLVEGTLLHRAQLLTVTDFQELKGSCGPCLS